jgi:membrane-associated phospholipid phosphatase
MFKNLKVAELGKLIIVLGTYAALYYLNNYYQVFTVHRVPRSVLDRGISFSPYWIYVYLLAYLMPVFLFFYLREKGLHLRYLSAFFILTILTNVVFFFFPTMIDRVTPILDQTDSITQLAFNLLFSIDQPFNCLPSTHVSTSFVAALILRKDRTQFILFLLLAISISYSSLAIGQHYFIDAVAGVIVALVSVLTIERLSVRRCF